MKPGQHTKPHPWRAQRFGKQAATLTELRVNGGAPIYTSLQTRGVGWSVWDMKARHRVAGPFKGHGAREACISEEMRLRRESLAAKGETR